jgi:hypothetical protein
MIGVAVFADARSASASLKAPATAAQKPSFVKVGTSLAESSERKFRCAEKDIRRGEIFSLA